MLQPLGSAARGDAGFSGWTRRGGAVGGGTPQGAGRSWGSGLQVPVKEMIPDAGAVGSRLTVSGELPRGSAPQGRAAGPTREL